jgi:hypothetical protein
LATRTYCVAKVSRDFLGDPHYLFPLGMDSAITLH